MLTLTGCCIVSRNYILMYTHFITSSARGVTRAVGSCLVPKGLLSLEFSLEERRNKTSGTELKAAFDANKYFLHFTKTVDCFSFSLQFRVYF